MREGGATRTTRKPGDRLARNPLLVGLLRREGVVMKRVLFAVCLAVPAFAQSTPQQPTINATVVVTASSLPETVQTTTAAVTAIARKDIEERAANAVADVVRARPALLLAR